jgi:hypothetical protein
MGGGGEVLHDRMDHAHSMLNEKPPTSIQWGGTNLKKRHPDRRFGWKTFLCDFDIGHGIAPGFLVDDVGIIDSMSMRNQYFPYIHAFV